MADEFGHGLAVRDGGPHVADDDAHGHVVFQGASLCAYKIAQQAVVRQRPGQDGCHLVAALRCGLTLPDSSP